ncbi:MAG: hypothetical protein JKY29_08820 [Gammaproteobacteria bacterium]|nr:hypothetical protein [Gammaproteobacteria bacterium]
MENLGARKYKLVFSLIFLLGLGLIIYGFSFSSFIPLWDPSLACSCGLGIKVLVPIESFFNHRGREEQVQCSIAGKGYKA